MRQKGGWMKNGKRAEKGWEKGKEEGDCEWRNRVREEVKMLKTVRKKGEEEEKWCEFAW